MELANDARKILKKFKLTEEQSVFLECPFAVDAQGCKLIEMKNYAAAIQPAWFQTLTDKRDANKLDSDPEYKKLTKEIERLQKERDKWKSLVKESNAEKDAKHKKYDDEYAAKISPLQEEKDKRAQNFTAENEAKSSHPLAKDITKLPLGEYTIKLKLAQSEKAIQIKLMAITVDQPNAKP